MVDSGVDVDQYGVIAQREHDWDVSVQIIDASRRGRTVRLDYSYRQPYAPTVGLYRLESRLALQDEVVAVRTVIVADPVSTDRQFEILNGLQAGSAQYSVLSCDFFT